MARQRSSTYKPYESAMMDTPAAYFIFEPAMPALLPALRVLYAVRAILSRPLSIKVLPKWFPTIPISGLRWIPYVTYGEILLITPLVILFLVGYSHTFVTPDLTSSGNIASYALYISFLTANKSNAVASFLLGISFEKMIPYHYMSAITAICLGCFHTYVAFVYGDTGSGDGGQDDRRLSGDSQYAKTGLEPDFLKFSFDGETNTSGTLLVLSLAGLTLFSVFPIIRRCFFDFWLWAHILLAIATIVFCFLHSVTGILFVTIWWGIDLAVRYLVMAGCRYPTTASIRALRPDLTEISFNSPPGFAYKAGQFVQIAIPKLSPIAFHPISISSAPHEDTVSLHIRALGGWTERLYKLAQQQDTVRILLEGPYGSVPVNLDDDKRYKRVLLVSGGIGVSHCLSVGKSLLYEHNKLGRKLNKLQFVWAVRDVEMVEDMPPLVRDDSTSPGEESASSASGTQPETAPTESSNNALVQTDIFLTKTLSSDSENTLTATYPSSTFHSGRPNLDKIVEEFKQEAIREGEPCVAVCGCGPASLLLQLQEACRKASAGALGCTSNGVDFDLHTETFEF